jgi:hypothetical protein
MLFPAIDPDAQNAPGDEGADDMGPARTNRTRPSRWTPPHRPPAILSGSAAALAAAPFLRNGS